MTSTNQTTHSVRRMIFHAPYPLNRQAKSASGIRPVRMRDAFAALGYEVWEVTGRAADRKRAISRVRRAIARGVKFDFCYSESSTMPTTMTEPNHLPLHPDLDFSFLRSLRAAGVRVGLFYRDIYWRFPEYGRDLPAAQKRAALAMYRYDLFNYRTATDLLYLPSMRMAPYVDDKAIQYAELPPGHDVKNPTPVAASPLKLLYVGGVNDHYKLQALVEALRELPEVSFTICTRDDEWASARFNYEPLSANVTVVHRSGPQLAELFEQANVAVMYTEPSDYYGFAFPVKLAEYLGWGKPVLAAQGALAGDLIADNGAGWTIPYGVEDVRGLLRELSEHPELVDTAAAKARDAAPHLTWEARAQQVADDLSGSSTSPRTVLLVGAAHSIHTARWANGLVSRGIDVHLATIHPLGVQEFDERVTIHKLPAAKGAGYVLAAPALRRLIERLRPDIINTHYATGYGTLTTAALPADQTPYTLSVWGADVYDVPTKSPAHERVVRANLARATTICSTSKAMAEQTRKWVSGKKIFLTPFGINMPDFPLKDLSVVPPDDEVVRIGTVKTLHPKYGVDTLIEAFALVHIAAKNTHLDIYGAGPQSEELEQLAYRLGISDNVTFHGSIPHSDVPAAMRALDVYVALSRLDSESFGVAILEASASGVPVVVSDASGPAEVTENDVTGFIVPRENPQAAADAIVKLAMDPNLRRRMGAAGRQHVEDNYTWEHSLDTMIDVYRQTIALTRKKRG